MSYFLGRTLDDKYPGVRQYSSRYALQVLFALNLLNCADRYVPSAVKPLYTEELHLSDFESSLPFTGIALVTMLSAMCFGVLADKNVFDRRYIMCFAIFFWSLATALAGLATNLFSLVILRSLVGIGEGAYSTISPPMISDFFPESERNVAFGIYYIAIPVGSAIGFGIGSFCGDLWGWRVAFFICGVPGIFASLLMLRIPTPVRGINDARHLNSSSGGPRRSGTSATYSSHIALTKLTPSIARTSTSPASAVAGSDEAFAANNATSSAATTGNSADPPSWPSDASDGEYAPVFVSSKSQLYLQQADSNVLESREKETVRSSDIDWREFWADLKEIITNPFFVCVTGGTVASTSK